MFKSGDYIIYGSTGVCLVADIFIPESIADLDEARLYYKLTPLLGSEIIYVPVDAPVFMRPIITKGQAEALIDKIPEISSSDFEGKDRRQTVESYKLSIGTHNCEDLIKLIKAVYCKTQNLIKCGKKPGQTDTQYLKQAETLLHSELATALNIPFDDVPTYIAVKLNNMEHKDAMQNQ